MTKEETELLDDIAELVNLIRLDKKSLKELKKWLKNKPIKEIIENRWNKKTKEIIKDNLIMFWSFMGSLIFGTFFMLNESGNITGGVIKEIYSYVNTTFKILIVLFVLIYGYFIIKLIGKE